MWERSDLKTNAKRVLGGTYWVSFAACIIAGILGGGGSGISFNGWHGSNNSAASPGPGAIGAIEHAALIPILLGIVSFALIIGIGVSIFFSMPIQAGLKHFFIRSPYGDVSIGNVFTAFKAGRYLSIVKTLFFQNLYIFLWSLLLIIPGIIKSYQYRMVPYIITEDPSLTTEQALDLSRRMTEGEIWDMFVLDLSFIGWCLLAGLTFGIGLLFLNPYYEATWAQLYFTLKPKVMAPPPYYPEA